MSKDIKYKKTGLPWCPEIPEDWEVIKLSYDFLKIGSGTTPQAGNPIYYQDGEFNWLQTGDLTDGVILETSKKITQKALDDYSTLRFYGIGSLVIAMYGATIGKCGILGIETTTNQACCVLAAPNRFDTKFIFYWFYSNKLNIISLSYGGGQPNINQELIRNFRVQCPPIRLQRKITTYLDRKTTEIDNLISKKQKLIECLKEERMAIINQAVTKGIDPNAEMKDSGIEWLVEIPKHWEVKKLKYVAEIGNGQDHKGVWDEEGEFPIIGTGGIFGKANSYLHKGPSVVLGRKGTIDKPQYIDQPFWCVDTAYYTTMKGCILIKFFFYFCLTIPFDNFKYGSAVPSMSQELLKHLLVPFPKLREQSQIISYIESETSRIDTTISKIEQEIELIKEYRTALINEVVTGKKLLN